MENTERPAKIEQADENKWVASCEFCEAEMFAPTYQEASIKLTAHFDAEHPGWKDRNNA